MEGLPDVPYATETESIYYSNVLSAILDRILASSSAQLDTAVNDVGLLRTDFVNLPTMEEKIFFIFKSLDGVIDSVNRQDSLVESQVWTEILEILQQIEIFRSAAPQGSLPHHILSSKLGAIYYGQFKRFGSHDDISKAIKLSEELLSSLPGDKKHRVKSLGRQSIYFAARYTSFGDMEDLEKAISLTEEFQSLVPSDEQYDQAAIPSNLSRHYYQRYQRLGRLEDLNTAILRSEDGITLSAESPDRPLMLSMLSTLLASKYERSGDTNDLERSISCCRESVISIAPQNKNQALVIRSLSGGLCSKFRASGLIDDLLASLNAQAEKALELAMPTGPDRVLALTSVSTCRFNLYKRFGDINDLQLAIKCTEEALLLAPTNHPDRVDMSVDICDYLYHRYDCLEDLQDLERAIEQTERNISSTPVDNLLRPSMLANQSDYLSCRYRQLGLLEDLENAIDRAEQAIATTPANDLSRNSRLIALSVAVSLRYERFESLGDIESCIELASEALASALGNDANRPAWLSCLGDYLYKRYMRLGTLEDLEKAIKGTGEGLSEIPVDHPARSTILRSLSNHLNARYEHTLVFEDLIRAIRRGEEALSSAPLYHPERLNCLINLSNCIFQRYKRMKHFDDLQKTIDLTHEALSKIPAFHPDRADILGNLSTFLAHKYQRSRDVADLDVALKVSEEAIDSIHPAHPYKAGILMNLANQLSQGFEDSGASELLDKAIKVLEEALSLTAPENPHYAMILVSLGSFIDAKCSTHALIKDTYYAIGLYQVARDCISSQPYLRIMAARNSSGHYYRLQIWDTASALIEDAVLMLPQVCPRSAGRHNLQHRLTEYSQLSAKAVSVAFKAGKSASHCLGLLELGRGIIMSIVIDCRSDFSELRIGYPDLYTKFESLRSEVDSPFDYDDETYEEDRNRRLEAAAELAVVLDDIRQLPTFKGFLLPSRPDNLMAMASEGPMVLVSSTELGSDAIIITSSTIARLPLPDLTYEEIIERMRQLREDILRGKRSTLPLRNRKLQELLLWLWDTVVGPVCENIELQPTVDGTCLPRIWWIGVGPLAMAPFHAAGDHSPGSERNITCRAISSYTPTMKALSYAREGNLDLLEGPSPKILAVTMPTTPGQQSLRGASDEVHKIAHILEEDGHKIHIMEHPGATEVLEELQHYEAVHFSCHGVPDILNPSNSRLLLFQDDGTETGKVDPLTVGAISDRNMRKINAQLAYLSACSTAVNSSEDLADEPIHIAGGFQLAGFSHVLATLWKSGDAACEEVAIEFYRLLFEDGGCEKGHRKVSYAFHHAVRKLRERMWRQPILWACFIHTGA